MSFPQYGKHFGDFSTLWKIFFHTVEKMACFFHTMEKYFVSFPHNGKNVSTVWKTSSSPVAEAVGDEARFPAWGASARRARLIVGG